jgi:hypothetical protein
MIGGRKTRSNKGTKRGPRKSKNNTGRTRSGIRFRVRNTVKKTRKVRSNKGKKRGPRTGRTRSGVKFRGRKKTYKQELTPSEMARLDYSREEIKQKFPSLSSNELNTMF